ncbi:unnamed protein product, partial [Phaeothamnion confervicola]
PQAALLACLLFLIQLRLRCDRCSWRTTWVVDALFSQAPRASFKAQVINVFLVTTIAGSALDVLTRIINHPSDTLTLLGETLPK